MSRKKKNGQFCSFFLDKKTADNLDGISKLTKLSKTSIVEQCLKREAARYVNEQGEIASIPAIYHPSTDPDKTAPCLILKKTNINGVPGYRILTAANDVRNVPVSAVTIQSSKEITHEKENNADGKEES